MIGRPAGQLHQPVGLGSGRRRYPTGRRHVWIKENPMSMYRHQLPQLNSDIFITDAGLETMLIFEQGIELPGFAAFTLLDNEAGTATLRSYYTTYAELARRHRRGLVLEAATWRANRNWGERLGYDPAELAVRNRRAIDLLVEIRERYANAQSPMVISGALGPRGDGYRVETRLSSAEAQRYHAEQIDVFADTQADMVAAFTLNYVEEAIGIAAAARAASMPVAISFTVETDGRLPSGDSLRSAIERTDAASAGYPAYYMINCAHPSHFEPILAEEGDWLQRIRGLRANASSKSHAELDQSTELDAGNPAELGEQYRGLHARLDRLAVVGGCCGTDHRHVEAICQALAR
jgi:S-methylmethionine-dependent homocysteine/selenocysteine methylase